MVFLHLQSAYLYTIQLFQVNIYIVDQILTLTKTLAENIRNISKYIYILSNFNFD